MIRIFFRSLVVASLVLSGMLANGAAFSQTTNQQVVKTIFDYKTELNLTDAQEKQIKQILTDLNHELQLENAKHTISSFALQDLIKKEANLDEIKKALDQEASLRASISYADIVATRKINKVLSSDQLQKWRTIQDAAR
jgi:DNA helicase IV